MPSSVSSNMSTSTKNNTNVHVDTTKTTGAHWKVTVTHETMPCIHGKGTKMTAHKVSRIPLPQTFMSVIL